ncbi:hypothetical protein [Paraburkholderia sp. J11-2]|uniref:hypothetical protein n=1 Tax=Paraburkholderia sp. J11-2 TaxID=2805431 RepID=UPI002AB7389A|nr:hypothetical protein [Paraburkholderia sp. J11-2]
MFDAEAAVTLLNNWGHEALAEGWPVCLEILQEGNLAFTHEQGYIGERSIFDAKACHAESLRFCDGSRAVRLISGDSAGGWTRWTALLPVQPLQ